MTISGDQVAFGALIVGGLFLLPGLAGWLLAR